MKHTVTGKTRRGVLLVSAALAVGSLTGCSALSPSTATKPYNPGDGIGATIGDSDVNPDINDAMVFRNMLLVKPADSTSGNLVGSIDNKTDEDLTVSFTLLNAAGDQPLAEGSIKAPAQAVTKLGTAPGIVQFNNIEPKAGEVLRLRAQTAAGGTVLSLPLLPPSDNLQSYQPTAPATSIPGASTSPSASASASPTS